MGSLNEYIDGWIGVPYLWGGNDKKGVDCSGFVINVYKDVMGIQIKNRISYNIYKELPIHVTLNEIKKGDILFFKMKDDKISHMGVYLGENKFALAGSKGVVIVNLKVNYWLKRFHKAGRYK